MEAPYQRTRVTGPVLGPQLISSGGTADAAYTWDTRTKSWKLTSSGGSALTGVSGPGTYDYDAMTDVVTPGYSYLSGQGVIINNDMTKDEIHQRWLISPSIKCSGHWRIPGVKEYFWSIAGSPKATSLGLCNSSGPNMLQLAATGPEVTRDIEAEAGWALAEAFQALSSSPINVWVSTGEFRESLQSFLNIYRKIDALVDFHKKPNRDALVKYWIKRKKAGQVLKWKDLRLCSNHWLEMRYGFRPLVRELTAALRLLDRVMTRTRRRFSAFREIKCDELSQIQQRNVGAGYSAYPNIGYSILARWEREFHISAGVLAEPKYSENNLLTLIGAGSLVQGAWDLVPYSFCIQWFANVSAWLSAWAPSLLVEPRASWYIIREVERRTCRVNPGSCYVINPHPGYGPLLENVASLEGCLQWERVRTRRIANPDRMALPEVRFALRAINCLDALGLLFQRLY